MVTGYAGSEEAVLRLRNANRERPENRAYLDWRYSCPPDAPAPLVFWLLSASGERIGMAAVIFRLYWIDGVARYVAVLGDIGVNATYRGQGLGNQLLKFLTDYLDQHHPQMSFVIPTESARRTLASVGWKEGGRLIPHVLLVNPQAKLRSVLGNNAVTDCAVTLYRGLVSRWQRLWRDAASTLEIHEPFPAGVDEIWNDTPRAGLSIRDMSIATFAWRYGAHPHLRTRVAQLTRNGATRGYLVFAVEPENRMCLIYELLARDRRDVGALLALFAGHCMENPEIATVRVLLNDTHPYRSVAWKLGFVPRAPVVHFQLRCPPGCATPNTTRWFLTYGDKDV